METQQKNIRIQIEEEKVPYIHPEESNGEPQAQKNLFGAIISRSGNIMNEFESRESSYYSFSISEGAQNTKSFTEAEFDSHRRDCITRLSAELGLQDQLSNKILQRNGWNYDKALQDALENADYYPLLEKKDDSVNNEKSIISCPICWNEHRTEDAVFLPCSHPLCKSCLKEATKSNFKNGVIKCPKNDCKVLSLFVKKFN